MKSVTPVHRLLAIYREFRWANVSKSMVIGVVSWVRVKWDNLVVEDPVVSGKPVSKVTKPPTCSICHCVAKLSSLKATRFPRETALSHMDAAWIHKPLSEPEQNVNHTISRTTREDHSPSLPCYLQAGFCTTVRPQVQNLTACLSRTHNCQCWYIQSSTLPAT